MYFSKEYGRKAFSNAALSCLCTTMQRCFGLSGFLGRFCSHHNFDGDDSLVIMVRVKFTPDEIDFTLWFSQMVKI